ncbi:MAG: tyrosine-protein phosphatase [Acidobacteriota bacterium]|nr:tyrosine-protein phosphatase [Acidobacteriota bacterium]
MRILRVLGRRHGPRRGFSTGEVKLEGGMNVRELGGYATPSGRTLSHRFLRSGSTAGLTRADARRLWGYGVRGVLDLRGRDEATSSPERLCDLLNVAYLNVSLHDYDVTDRVLDAGDEAGGYLAGTYFQMLANHDAVAQAFSFFCVQPERSCTLFHCGAGSDRTGIVSMLLLGLAGVAREEIVADYAYSFGYIPEVNAVLFEHAGTARQSVRAELRMRIDAISAVYDRLVGTYGSVAGYLAAAGVASDELTRVRTRLLG